MVRINLIIFGLFLTFNLFGQYPRIILKQLQKADSSGQFIIADSDSNAVWSDALYITTDSLLTLYGDTIQGGVNYEKIQDTIAAMLEAGLGIQMTYNDADGEFLIESLSIEDSIYNGSGSLISKGTPLYAVGTQGNYWNVAPADASDITKLPAVVIAGEDIGIGETGVGLLKGHIKQVNTTGLADGDEVYVGVGGGYTNVKPKGESNYVQRLGTVIKGNDANGSGIINLGEVQSVSNLNAGNIFIGDTDSTITTTVYIVDSSRVNATGDSLIYYQNGIQVGADKLEGGVFVDDGTYVYYNGGKNVGIGTTTPFRELHILNSENNKTVFLIENTQNNPFSTAEIGMLQGSSFFNLVNYSDSASATVSGLSLANKGLLQTSNGMDGIVYAPINGQNYFLYDSRFDSDLLYIDATNDRIGIKDTTPTATLDVTGWVNITDSLVVNDIRVTGSGGGTINGVTTDATLTGDGTSGTPLKVDTSIIATQGDLSDYVTIAGIETITGAKTFTSDIVVQNEETNTNAAELNLYKKNGSSSGDVTVGDNIGNINFKAENGATTVTSASIEVDATTVYNNEIGGDMVFKTASEFHSRPLTEAMRIDKLGNISLDSTLFVDATNNRVGIDTSSPGHTLHINKNVTDGVRALLIGDTPTYPARNNIIDIGGTHEMNFDGSGFNYTPIKRNSNFSSTFWGFILYPTIDLQQNLSNYGNTLSVPQLKTNGHTLTNYINAYYRNDFLTSTGSVTNSYVVRILSNDYFGGVGIKPTNQYGLYIDNQGTSGMTTSYGLYIDSQSGATNSYPLYIGNFTSGTLSASSGIITASSDQRLKNEDGLVENGIEKINQLIPRYFYWKDQEMGLNRQIGFFAQEVNAVIPEAAPTPNESEYWGLYDRGLIAVTVKAIQEQQAIIDQQETEIEQLKSQIQLILSEIEQIKNN